MTITNNVETAQMPVNSQKKPAPWNWAKKPPLLMLVWITDTNKLPIVTVSSQQAIMVDFIEGGAWV